MLLTFYIELFEVRGRGVIVHFVDICGMKSILGQAQIFGGVKPINGITPF
jgi:hypothetical protein